MQALERKEALTTRMLAKEVNKILKEEDLCDKTVFRAAKKLKQEGLLEQVWMHHEELNKTTDRDWET